MEDYGGDDAAEYGNGEYVQMHALDEMSAYALCFTGSMATT